MAWVLIILCFYSNAVLMFRQLILVLFVSYFCLFSVSTDAVKPQGGGGRGGVLLIVGCTRSSAREGCLFALPLNERVG